MNSLTQFLSGFLTGTPATATQTPANGGTSQSGKGDSTAAGYSIALTGGNTYGSTTSNSTLLWIGGIVAFVLAIFFLTKDK